MVTRRARRPAPNLTLAVAYLRLSKDDNGNIKKGKRASPQVGLDVQRARIEAWAAREGVTVVAWVEAKGESGGAPIDQRPRLQATLQAMRETAAGVLLVHDRSRLARDVLTALLVERDLQNEGRRIISVDGAGNGDDPNDKLLRTFLSGVDEHYRANIIAKTKAALAAKAARGERTGTVPYGYRVGADNVHLEPDPHEQAVIAAARDLRASGMTLQAITEELECRGLVNRKGKPFSLPAIHAMTGGAS